MRYTLFVTDRYTGHTTCEYHMTSANVKAIARHERAIGNKVMIMQEAGN